jgi:hypothetical protein
LLLPKLEREDPSVSWLLRGPCCRGRAVFASLLCPHGSGARCRACRVGARCAHGRDTYGFPSRTLRPIGCGQMCGLAWLLPCLSTLAPGRLGAGGQAGWACGPCGRELGQRVRVIPTCLPPDCCRATCPRILAGSSGLASRSGASGDEAGGVVSNSKGFPAACKACPLGGGSSAAGFSVPARSSSVVSV